MRVIIVGFGIQGMKRKAILVDVCSAIVDPVSNLAQFKKVEDVPLDTYDAAFVCTPDASKLSIIEYLIKNSKHVLCEKPLSFPKSDDFDRIETLANFKNVKLYAAYNHKFEKSIIDAKKMIDSNSIGRIYQLRLLYGNGTAKHVANSDWRDTGLGIIPDLGSHCISLVNYWFPNLTFSFKVVNVDSYENKAPDYALLVSDQLNPRIIIELSYCSWKNTFYTEIVGEGGTIRINGLCKWGKSKLIRMKRVLPSGIPVEDTTEYELGDKTWKIEQNYFFDLIVKNTPVDLKVDKLIFNSLNLTQS